MKENSMDQKQEKAGRTDGLNRRELMRTGAVAAAGLAVGGMQSGYAATDVTKTRSYNPEMKYRPLGKTGLMIHLCAWADTGNASTRWFPASSKAIAGSVPTWTTRASRKTVVMS